MRSERWGIAALPQSALGLWGSHLPRKGWVYLGVEDTGKLSSQCEFCGTDIRYEHYVVHPDVGNGLKEFAVGCNCAAYLTQDYVTPLKEAARLKDKLDKLGRWVRSANWHKEPGRIYRKHKGVTINIYQRTYGQRLGYVVWINKIRGKKFYRTIEDAKKYSFRGVQWYLARY